MGHLEKNELTLPISSPQLKSESLLIMGLIANNVAQRLDDCGQAGGGRGTGIEPSPPRKVAPRRSFFVRLLEPFLKFLFFIGTVVWRNTCQIPPSAAGRQTISPS
jgi:hypothetical protein